MSSVKDADRCIQYLDGSILEGRVITVEKVSNPDILLEFICLGDLSYADCF